jgi:hypothetical protein
MGRPEGEPDRVRESSAQKTDGGDTTRCRSKHTCLAGSRMLRSSSRRASSGRSGSDSRRDRSQASHATEHPTRAATSSGWRGGKTGNPGTRAVSA